MRKFAGGLVVFFVAVLNSGCGALLGAGAGYTIDRLAGGRGDIGVIAGATVGGATELYFGALRQERLAAEHAELRRQAAIAAQQPVEKCYWENDSRGRQYWFCEGQQIRSRLNGPPVMRFIVPDEIRDWNGGAPRQRAPLYER